MRTFVGDLKTALKPHSVNKAKDQYQFVTDCKLQQKES